MDKANANSIIIIEIPPEKRNTSLFPSLDSEYDHKNCVAIKYEIAPTKKGVTYNGSLNEKIILNMKNSTKMVMTKETMRADLSKFIVRKVEIAKIF